MASITDGEKWNSLVAYASGISLANPDAMVANGIIWADDRIKALENKVEDEFGKGLITRADLITTVETLTESNMLLDIENDHLKAILKVNNIEYADKPYQGELHPFLQRLNKPIS